MHAVNSVGHVVGHQSSNGSVSEKVAVTPRHAATSALSLQPRGRRIPNILSEYAELIWLNVVDVPELNKKMCTTTSVQKIEPGAKLVFFSVGEWKLSTSELKRVRIAEALRRTNCPMVGIIDHIQDKQRQEGKGSELDIDMDISTLCALGVFRTPQMWHEQARLLPFPADVAPFVRPWHAKALKGIFGVSPCDLVRIRKQKLVDILAVAKKLEKAEFDIKAKMPEHIAENMKHKKLLLFKYLLDQVGVDGTKLVENISRGFGLVGDSFSADLFPVNFVQASKSEEDLLEEAAWRVEYATSKTASSGDPELDCELYNKTVQERDEGSIQGPFSKLQLDHRFGPGSWIPARRFGLWQSSSGKRKMRPIDDFSFNYHNATVEIQEKLDHGGLDEVAAMAILIKRSLLSGVFSFVDTDGSNHSFKIHPDWHKTSKKVVGKTLDLKAAYKQLCVREDHLRYAVTTVYNPTSKKPEFWVCTGLPFGSTASVYGFNACSRSLERILSEHFLVLVSSYFDDFPSLEVEDTCRSAKAAMEGLLQVLGWDFVKEEHKYVEYSAEFRVLGVRMHLGTEQVVLKNIPERMTNIQELCEELLRQNSWRKHALDKLLGRCSFARTYVVGRPLNVPMAILYSAMAKDRVSVVPSPDELEAVKLIRQFALHSRPRTFPCKELGKPVLLYTDGACEADGSTFGSVLFDGSSSAQVFEGRVPRELLHKWRRLNVRHAIAQVELLPVLLSLNTWKEKLLGVDLLIFTDNSSVKEALVTGSSKSLASRDLLVLIASILVELHVRLWIARVPSKSNPADAPSRGRVAELEAWTQVARVAAIWPAGL